MPKKSISFGSTYISIDDVVSIANQLIETSITNNPKDLKRIVSSNSYLNEVLEKEGNIYGVTTGYGESCTVGIPKDLIEELPIHLTRFHGCGLGAPFTELQGRAILAVRLASLARGVSGARVLLLKRLSQFMNLGIIPVIPQEGSVGASGDLTPLSYVAATLMNERDVYFKGKIISSEKAHKLCKIKPIKLMPKEALAVMNGTSVMTAIACLAYDRSRYLAKISSRITAMMVIAMQGNPHHFDKDLFDLKPHPGQTLIAKWIRDDLIINKNSDGNRIQDRYSLRCAPHVIGVLQDALPWMKTQIETEINSSNDNPLIDGQLRKIMHGGHFYGGHIAFAMDGLKTAVANIADLLDRQVALLMDKTVNNGLPRNLSAADSSRKYINHGFKAVQIATSAWTAEALKLTMPASVFSRSTESHNQDKVSMGTIASRDCLRVLQLTEQVAAAAMLAAKQSIMIRLRNQELKTSSIKKNLLEFINTLEDISPIVTEDRPLDKELTRITNNIQNQYWENK